jgi:hypothetical protein
MGDGGSDSLLSSERRHEVQRAAREQYEAEAIRQRGLVVTSRAGGSTFEPETSLALGGLPSEPNQPSAGAHPKSKPKGKGGKGRPGAGGAG